VDIRCELARVYLVYFCDLCLSSSRAVPGDGNHGIQSPRGGAENRKKAKITKKNLAQHNWSTAQNCFSSPHNYFFSPHQNKGGTFFFKEVNLYAPLPLPPPLPPHRSNNRSQLRNNTPERERGRRRSLRRSCFRRAFGKEQRERVSSFVF